MNICYDTGVADQWIKQGGLPQGPAASSPDGGAVERKWYLSFKLDLYVLQIVENTAKCLCRMRIEILEHKF